MQQTATVAAPTWYRSPAEVAAYRAEKQRLYREYREATQHEVAVMWTAEWNAAVEATNAAWERYCDVRDRGI